MLRCGLPRPCSPTVGDRQYQARTLLAQADLAADLQRVETARALVDEAIEQLRRGGWLVPLAWAVLRQSDLARDVDRAGPRT